MKKSENPLEIGMLFGVQILHLAIFFSGFHFFVVYKDKIFYSRNSA
ncbi:hypothetical protein HMPREF9080_01096 [Cardiobacterium valvarum F0432]|uniref:Uncharacterized protein n=1 Tax=Cardiobacterium valvarum F0432 TaxID=797473 RepID=G9ZEA9_9GAMM|nr:hypothetical protein HMPREF9080_01096 [Cardiobacterium valvarum F0432]